MPTTPTYETTAGVPSFFASRQEPREASPAQAVMDNGMAAWTFLPLTASGNPVGACVLGYDQPYPFTPEERLTLTSFSALIAQAWTGHARTTPNTGSHTASRPGCCPTRLRT
ncbi:GAF domain-containing protein [Streptomyces sp. NPDC002896]|uniref:GAF domain-containing protein n=1 Tax=Streptomyces sp. NPDC002896 TaxID=3154438 RepID=UPI00332568A9